MKRVLICILLISLKIGAQTVPLNFFSPVPAGPFEAPTYPYSYYISRPVRVNNYYRNKNEAWILDSYHLVNYEFDDNNNLINMFVSIYSEDGKNKSEYELRNTYKDGRIILSVVYKISTGEELNRKEISYSPNQIKVDYYHKSTHERIFVYKFEDERCVEFISYSTLNHTGKMMKDSNTIYVYDNNKKLTKVLESEGEEFHDAVFIEYLYFLDRGYIEVCKEPDSGLVFCTRKFNAQGNILESAYYSNPELFPPANSNSITTYCYNELGYIVSIENSWAKSRKEFIYEDSPLSNNSSKEINSCD